MKSAGGLGAKFLVRKGAVKSVAARSTVGGARKKTLLRSRWSSSSPKGPRSSSSSSAGSRTPDGNVDEERKESDPRRAGQRIRESAEEATKEVVEEAVEEAVQGAVQGAAAALTTGRVMDMAGNGAGATSVRTPGNPAARVTTSGPATRPPSRAVDVRKGARVGAWSHTVVDALEDNVMLVLLAVVVAVVVCINKRVPAHIRLACGVALVAVLVGVVIAVASAVRV